jgi:hypothetical protein
MLSSALSIVNRRRELAFMEIINRPLRNPGEFAHRALWTFSGFARVRSSIDGWILKNQVSIGALGGTRTPTILLTATSRQRVYQFRHERFCRIGRDLGRTGSTAPM